MFTVARVRERGGFGRLADAERAILATLEALGGFLLPAERALVAAALPESFASHLEGPATASIVGRVAEREGVRPSIAKEHAETVLAVMVEDLDPEARERLRRILPAEVATALEPPPPSGHEPARPQPIARPTLAGGRPGSLRPLSESSADRTQSHSVATPNPHAARKLSSAPGSRGE
jgi:uncharacterized protein (DUF2267 family)